MEEALSWKDVLGHEGNIHRLRTMLRDGRLPHALLFSGISGVGKKKVARLLAAALLCGREDAPCGVCPSCRAFLAGTHSDYVEAAPESRGKGVRVLRIDAVREIEKKAARKPLLSGRFVVLVDDADAMNEAAANSLLKTLEEPQGAVFFLLVTAKRTAILPTILSRVRDMHFGALSPEGIEEALLARGVESQKAHSLAMAADGSLGHALLLLEGGGLQLMEDAAETLFSLSALNMFSLWAKAEELGKLPRDRAEEWLLALSRLLRDMLALLSGRGTLYHEEKRGALAHVLADFPETRIFACLALVRETLGRLRSNASVQLLFEGLLMRLRDARESER